MPISHSALTAEMSKTQRLDELTHDLDTSAIELHGNYVWGSASRVYAPMLNVGDEIKVEHIRRALRILNSTDLAPLDKATRILQIPGFGPNITTGLVMLFAPNEFAISNTPSRTVLKELGYDVGAEANLAQFEHAVGQLRAKVGAEDFLELDYFLYLLNVNQISLQPRIVKIAPGELARLWSECLAGGYICVGWDELGDLRQYPSKEAMRSAYFERHVSKPEQRGPASAKVDEIWTLRELLPGDIVIANKGTSEVVGLGEVTDPGYVWRPERAEYKHTVTVQWDTSLAKRIPEQKVWAFKTVAPVSPELYQLIIAPDTPMYWWVNQGDSYDQESVGGYLFASREDQRGATLAHHERLTQMRPGDMVLHYGRGAIQAASTVQDAAVTVSKSPNPARDYTVPGYLVRTAYRRLNEPISLASIPLEWRTRETEDAEGEEDGPFDIKGNPKFGYAFRLTSDFVDRLRAQFPDRFSETQEPLPSPAPVSYAAPAFDEIREAITRTGMRLADQTLRRYHLALKTRGFVILSGLSGAGKTWLAIAYAKAVNAEHLVVPVAPNWTTNEDLLGYYNPIDAGYHDTPFSRFLRQAERAYLDALGAGRTPRPYHLILDEMNLARVEYYFARFLSAMETRAHAGSAAIELAPDEAVTLPPNLYFVGTVNIDETTQSFADKVYDRAQLIELGVSPDLLSQHLGAVPYHDVVMNIWSALRHVAPFAFRVIDDMKAYIQAAADLKVSWEEALDEQLLQKVLPKCKGADPRIEPALTEFIRLTEERFPLSSTKATTMLERFRQHGFATYF